MLLLSAIMPMNVYAESKLSLENDLVTPFWQNIAAINIVFGITDGRAELTGTVVANTGTERISVNAILDRVNTNGTTTRIASWNNLTTNGNTWAWTRTHMVARGHDYRLTLEVTAVRNGIWETVSVSRTVRAN